MLNKYVVFYLILNIKWPTRSLVQALIKTRISDLIKIIINIINYCNNTQDNLDHPGYSCKFHNIIIYLIQIGIFCFIQMLNKYYVLLPYSKIKWPTRSLVQALIKTRISDLIKIIINIINYCDNTTG